MAKKKKDITERLMEISCPDSRCQGRCVECPHDIAEEAAELIKKLRADLSWAKETTCY